MDTEKKRKINFLEIGMVVCFILIVISIVWLAIKVNSGEKTDRSLLLEGQPLERGQIVYTKLKGDPVHVISVEESTKKVECRVSSGVHERDGLVSKDSYEGDYAIVEFNLFELTREKK